MAGRAGWRRASRYGDGKTAGKRCQRRENAVRNRIFFKVVNGAGTTISTQTYNALGQRVRDVTTSATTDEAYGAGGSLLWRYTGSSSNSSQRAFVPFNGRILAEYYGGSPGGTLFHHPDELGSDTVSTSYNGSICQEKLFYPFGQFWTGAGSCGMQQVFAQLPDYDAETNQYNTPNRHYAPMGRWMSPDPHNAGADSSDPQTWNMYAYAGNNPTTNVDPDGTDYYILGGQACGHNGVVCDDLGYVVDDNGARITFADQAILNNSVSYTLGPNGVATINGFQAEFYDNTPFSVDVNGVPGSEAAAATANFVIGMYNLGADTANSSLAWLTIGQYSMNLPHLPGGEGWAAYSGLTLAMVVPAAVPGEEGSGLTRGGRRVLGNLVGLADKTVAEAILARGGGGAQVQMLETGMAQKTVAEVANAAASGERAAVQAIKMIKQAAIKAGRTY